MPTEVRRTALFARRSRGRACQSESALFIVPAAKSERFKMLFESPESPSGAPCRPMPVHPCGKIPLVT